MEKIKYEYGEDLRCLTPCPHDANVKVHSFACQDCPHYFGKVIDDGGSVLCGFPDEVSVCEP